MYRRPAATYAAWGLPVYLPVTSGRRGRSLDVWGCVRPAVHATATGAARGSQTAAIQFAPITSGGFTTIQTVTLGAPSNCYFDIRVKFPGSGTVRLSYDDSPLDPTLTADREQIESRPVRISPH
jgi:hypothetical protein